MSSINKSEIAVNHIRLDINLSADEIAEEFKKALKKEQKKTNLKGFRKGKAPISVVRKFFGQRILANLVYEKMNETLSDYIFENELKHIGQPLPLHEEGANDLNPKNIKDYNFSFELGLIPEIDLSNWNNQPYHKYEIEISEEDIDNKLSEWRKRMGSQKSVDQPIENNDVVNLELMEMEDGKIKPDGISTETKIHIESLKNEELKNQLLGKSIGDSLDIDIYSLAPHPEKKEEHIREYILKVEENQSFNKEFKAGIDEVLRLEEAELDQGFFESVFGPGKVSNEEEAREETKKFLKASKKVQINNMLFREVKNRLIETTEVMLPIDFIKRWTEEVIKEDLKAEKSFDSFVEKMRWSLINDALSKEFDLTVKQEEIVESAYSSVFQYGIQDRKTAEHLVNELLSNKEYAEEVKNNIWSHKFLEAVAENAKTEVTKVSPEEFDQIYADFTDALEREDEEALEEE